jgi:hypothetical protein
LDEDRHACTQERTQLPAAPPLSWPQPMPLPYPTLLPPRRQNLARRRDASARGRQLEENNHNGDGGEPVRLREDRDGQADGGWQRVEERQRRHQGQLQSSVLDRIDRRAASQVAKLRRCQREGCLTSARGAMGF